VRYPVIKRRILENLVLDEKGNCSSYREINVLKERQGGRIGVQDGSRAVEREKYVRYGQLHTTARFDGRLMSIRYLPICIPLALLLRFLRMVAVCVCYAVLAADVHVLMQYRLFCA
jgi:hypothetical protein